MKKVILSLGVMFFTVAVASAQDDHAGHNHDNPAKMVTAVGGTTAADGKANNALHPENMVFTTETHDFGVIPEGPAAEYEFEFKNTGKEPIVLQQVHASCGCTTPSYSKDPVLPGKTGKVKASYATQGRPNAFTKTITVMSNIGVKTLTIKGTVEKAPEGSVPASTSMMKTN